MKRIALGLFAVFAFASAYAIDTTLNIQGAYNVPNHSGYRSDGFASPAYTLIEGDKTPTAQRDLGSTWGGAEAKLSISIADQVPFFVGEGAMLSGNNIRGKVSFEGSPVSFNALGQLSLTPIAFLVFDAGAGIGTGWTAGPFQGLGLNPIGNAAGSDISLTPFGGAVWRAWGAGTFQFDLAALFPGDWSHIIIMATAKGEYKAFTGAGDREAWLWEADSGENFNGIKYFGTYVLAYQPPMALNLVGVLIESEEWLGDVRGYSPAADAGGWGSDYRLWQVAALFNFTLGKNDSLAILTQFKRKIDWTDATTRNRDFRTRDYDGTYWYFNRVAFSYTHSF